MVLILQVLSLTFIRFGFILQELFSLIDVFHSNRLDIIGFVLQYLPYINVDETLSKIIAVLYILDHHKFRFFEPATEIFQGLIHQNYLGLRSLFLI